MRIRTRIILVFLPSVLLLATILGATLWSWAEMDQESVQIFKRTAVSVISSANLLSLARNMNMVEADYTVRVRPIPGHSPREAMAAFDRSQADFEQTLDRMRQNYMDAGKKARIEQVGALFHRYVAIDLEMRRLVLTGRLKDAEQLNYVSSNRTYDQLAAVLTDLQTYSQLHFKLRRTALLAKRDLLHRVAAVGALVAIALSLALGLRQARSLSKPIAALERMADELGNGNFEPPPTTRNIERTHELASLHQSLSRTAEALSAATRQLQETNANLEAQVRERTAELEQAYEDLKETDRLKDQFLSAVSHDLRTPLTTLMGYGRILQRGGGGALNPEQQDYVDTMLRASSLLLSLVNDLLDMNRIRAGKFFLVPAEVDLAALVADVLDLLQSLAVEKHLTLSREVVDEVPLVTADGRRLTQVLVNLVGNAIKFTPEGGTVRVRIVSEGDHVRCEVRDMAQSIRPEDASKLFNPFTQLGADLQATGSGLGLSICKSLIEAHGGQIGLEHASNAGNVFWFSIPIAWQDEAFVADPCHAPAAS
jgi:signal transduction histidine kinase